MLHKHQFSPSLINFAASSEEPTTKSLRLSPTFSAAVVILVLISGVTLANIRSVLPCGLRHRAKYSRVISSESWAHSLLFCIVFTYIGWTIRTVLIIDTIRFKNNTRSASLKQGKQGRPEMGRLL